MKAATIAGIAALTLIAAAGAVRAGKDAAPRGVAVCHVARAATAPELERFNQDDGMKPDQPFSIDDYCGAQCGPGRYAWQDCLDACRGCLEPVTLGQLQDEREASDR
jgi:hypothetical protein